MLELKPPQIWILLECLIITKTFIIYWQFKRKKKWRRKTLKVSISHLSTQINFDQYFCFFYFYLKTKHILQTRSYSQEIFKKAY